MSGIAKAVFSCINTVYTVSLDRLFVKLVVNFAAADIAKSGSM